MIINIFLPYIDANRKQLFKRLTIEGKESSFISLFICYLIFMFIVMFTYLIPKIKSINSYIYKTKKMLLIIPLSILASQNNIKSLLHLSNKRKY